MIQEHEKVVLTVDLPEYQLKAGDVGTVVHIYSDGLAYELELFTLEGLTLDVITVEATQVRSVSQYDVLHVREFRPYTSICELERKSGLSTL